MDEINLFAADPLGKGHADGRHGSLVAIQIPINRQPVPRCPIRDGARFCNTAVGTRLSNCPAEFRLEREAAGGVTDICRTRLRPSQ